MESVSRFILNFSAKKLKKIKQGWGWGKIGKTLIILDGREIFHIFSWHPYAHRNISVEKRSCETIRLKFYYFVKMTIKVFFTNNFFPHRPIFCQYFVTTLWKLGSYFIHFINGWDQSNRYVWKVTSTYILNYFS